MVTVRVLTIKSKNLTNSCSFNGNVSPPQKIHYIFNLSTMDNNLNRKIEESKTDNQELNKVLHRYDLDEQLEQEFNEIEKQFRRVEIRYLSLVNTRKFLNG